ncbi:uncharacterized protein [Venturia canescens]|uniref:uncharacterized protein n=1 Tax=Venturia canescens TaxID=32260 RepID=UPI001C9D1110|nr:uncharacterized protein LOC122412330 [Venturia canescens]
MSKILIVCCVALIVSVAGGASVTREQGSLDAAKDACINSIRETYSDMMMNYAFNHLWDNRVVYFVGLQKPVREGFRSITDLMDEVRDGKDPINVENGGPILFTPRHVLCNETIVAKLRKIVKRYIKKVSSTATLASSSHRYVNYLSNSKRRKYNEKRLKQKKKKHSSSWCNILE